MPTTIYYFTGTGNSLAVARRLAGRLGGCECVPIASLGGRERVFPEGGCVGLVFPVYYFGLPGIVRRFAGRLDLGRARYVFAVATMGGSSGRALADLDALLRSRGRGLDASFAVRVFSNYLPWFAIPDEGGQRRAFEGVEDRIDGIVGDVEGRRAVDGREGLLSRALWLLPNRFLARRAHDEDRMFSVDDACTSCGACERVCPVANINLASGRPAWHHRCEQCLACLHLCPVGAIQHGRGSTRGKRRYRHPDVTVDDIAAQRGERAGTLRKGI